jgi:2'-hydroxyisoflavone reductase
MTDRRNFLRTAIEAAMAVGLTPSLARAAETASKSRARSAPLDLLVLGGTGFIGPHLVRHAVARGHRVTIFTRGRRDADLPASVTRLIGDRNGQLGALEGKRWNAVIDDSATNPDWVRQSTTLLKDSVERYLFTSSTGVYYPYLRRGLDESSPIHYDAADPKDPSESFGTRKAQCERQVVDVFGDRGLVVRPTYIVGPGDTTDRFPYWPVRLARGGDVLAPGKVDDPVQIIDVRDLAEFMVRLIEQNRNGVFNAVGPRNVLTAREFYAAAAKALDASARFTFVDDYAFLSEHKIEEAIPWAMLKGNDFGMMSIKTDKAVGAGLTYRPLATTVRDTLAWWPSVPEERRTKPRFAITPEQEATALAAWRSRGKGARD